MNDKEIASIVRNNFEFSNIKKANEISNSLNNTLKNLNFSENVENLSSTCISLNDLKVRNAT